MDIFTTLRALPGQNLSGDQCFHQEKESLVFVGVIDGLGHGPKAHEAAMAAQDYFAENLSVDLVGMLHGCSKAIYHTRGVVAAMLCIDTNAKTLRHAGVGNIQFHSLSREPIRPVSQPGIVGSRIRKVIETQYQLHPADLLVLHSDGISSRFDIEDMRCKSARQVANQLIERFAKQHDDASCAVVRF
jgi:serine/threonine protein phosphatase PrpC